jgi:L-ascorbate metabolism protein UlaG (beta-lactamase superfamily)
MKNYLIFSSSRCIIIYKEISKSMKQSVIKEQEHFTQPKVKTIKRFFLYKKTQYVCSFDQKGNHSDHSHFTDAMLIGLVTFFKRIINSIIYLITLGTKGGYFAHGETDQDIYDQERMNTKPHPLIIFFCSLLNLLVSLITLFIVNNLFTFGERLYDEKKFLNDQESNIQNIGHATQLITLKEGNQILRGLTDPVFYNLNPLAYRAATDSALKIKNLPQIDFIMISHNHRDHLCKKSIKEIVKRFPNIKIIVPHGDSQLVKSWLGKNIQISELKWGENITLNDKVSITAVPANHWCNRGAFDIQQSYTNGYLINHSQDIIYFAGDTATLNDTHLKEMAKVITKQGIKDKKIISLMPGGPNYPRNLMKHTHMSIVESFLVYCKLLGEISKELTKDNLQDILNNNPMVVMHHNKWKLGPDTFNEDLWLMKKLLAPIENCQDFDEARKKITALHEKELNKWQLGGMINNDAVFYKEFVSVIEFFQNNNLTINDLKDAINKIQFPKIGSLIKTNDQKDLKYNMASWIEKQSIAEKNAPNFQIA